jgi:hypothetical protein
LKSEYFRGASRPVYNINYTYDKDGLVQSINQQFNSKGTWLPMLTRDFTYDAKNNIIIVKYTPGEDALKDWNVQYMVSNKKGAVDTIRMENGRVTERIQFRKEQYNDYLHKYLYTYDKGNLVGIKKNTWTYIVTKTKDGSTTKISKSSDAPETTFIYESGKIKTILHKEPGYTRKWVRGNETPVEKVLVYDMKDGKEELKMQDEYTFENGKLVYVADGYFNSNGVSMNTEESRFKYDENNNLIEDVGRDDTGGYGFRHTYEPGNGNASLFDEKFSPDEYLRPAVK